MRMRHSPLETYLGAQRGFIPAALRHLVVFELVLSTLGS